MQIKGLLVAVTGLLGSLSCAYAGTMNSTPIQSLNRMGYYLGIGGSYNWARIRSNTTGVLNAQSGFIPLGTFSGSISPYFNTADAFAPQVQVGYFQPLSNKNWLWGIELLYQYSRTNIKANGSTMDAGTVINLRHATANVVDAVQLNTVEKKWNNTFMLPFFIGRSYEEGFLYLGAGPALLNIDYKLQGIHDTSSAFYIGTINQISKTNWVWGGALQAGIAYYVNPSWFLKCNYTYASTLGRYSSNMNAPFSSAVNHGLNTGTFALNSHEQWMTQEVTLTINKVMSI